MARVETKGKRAARRMRACAHFGRFSSQLARIGLGKTRTLDTLSSLMSHLSAKFRTGQTSP
eukprot:6539473-Alexandrium_andersonii.AAC.1